MSDGHAPSERFLRLCAHFAAQGPYGHALSPPQFPLDDHDITQLFEGLEGGLISLTSLGRFNTLDRPTALGHWALLSYYRAQTIVNGEYVPQVACYVDLLTRLGYPPGRVLFEPGDPCERVDHAVLDDGGAVVVMGEAKVDPRQPGDLVARIRQSYSTAPPALSTRPPKGREYEAWKTADALWKLRPRYLWLVAPGVRDAFVVSFRPLTLTRILDLPTAAELGLDRPPKRFMKPRDTRRPT